MPVDMSRAPMPSDMAGADSITITRADNGGFIMRVDGGDGTKSYPFASVNELLSFAERKLSGGGDPTGQPMPDTAPAPPMAPRGY